ncbi:MAG: hypothetical protein KTR26_03880 [Flammeovirgaceae bacterium]|nr:hypothetical protein [Flammeovirgaceae bacterium]
MYLEARRGYGGLNHKSAILYFEEIEKLDSYNAWSNGKGIFFHRKIELGIFRNNKRNKETYVIFTEYKGGPHFMGWQEFWVFKVSLEELKDIRNGNIKFFLKYSLAERLKY